MIVGQNALLNQFVPVFYIKDLVNGQTLVYDSTKQAFINATGGGSGGATSLGQLTNVTPNVDSPLLVTTGQALVWNSFANLWVNQFIDFNTLLNKPTNASYTFIGLGDTNKTPVPNGYVLWNGGGTQLIYSATIPAGNITGLATVATTGNYNDLTNKPAVGSGSVTSVSITTSAGVSGTVVNPTTTPAITITLGGISPTSVAASGTVTGSNLSGNNTGDQTITLTGDVIGSGTGSFVTNLQNLGLSPGPYTNATITVDNKGRVTAISSGAAGVTSVGVSGGSTGLTTTGGPITSTGTITLTGTLALTNGGTGQASANAALNALLPSQATHNGQALVTNGTNTSWATVGGLGTVTSVAIAGSNGLTLVSGSPITTAGTITLGLGNITPNSIVATGTVAGSNLSGTNTGDQTITLTGDVNGSGTGSFGTTLSNTAVSAGTYGNSTTIPVFNVDSKGRLTSVTNTPISGINSTIEQVVFHYGAGSSGSFTPGDVIFSTTANVSATILDGPNCIATYTFSGYNTPPSSIMYYAQNVTANRFIIRNVQASPSANAYVQDAGTSTNPNLINGIFAPANTITLQTRQSDVGISSGVGQRAFLIVLFKF